MLSEVKKDLRVQNSTLSLGGRGWGRQGKEISKSTKQKGAILCKCVNTFVPHCSCFGHIQNNKINVLAPYDSRRIMQFVASVPFWFLAGKYAFDSLPCAALDNF